MLNEPFLDVSLVHIYLMSKHFFLFEHLGGGVYHHKCVRVTNVLLGTGFLLPLCELRG